MYYVKITFNVADSWNNFAYGFKINMLCGELEITYNNFKGDYITKGIKLKNKQFEHLKLLLKIENFEKFRVNPNKEEHITFLDPYNWSFLCISNDGNPILEITNQCSYYIKPPNHVIDLVKYVTKIGIEPEILKK